MSNEENTNEGGAPASNATNNTNNVGNNQTRPPHNTNDPHRTRINKKPKDDF